MPVLPDVESMITRSFVSAPRRSPSSIIESAGRSLTDPPGLNHSAFARTPRPGNSRSNMRTRNSGVWPMWLTIPAGTVRINTGYEPGAAGRRFRALREEVNRRDPDQHEDAAQRVADDRSAGDASALRGQDVEHGLPDEKPASEHRDRRVAAQHAIEKDDREDDYLAQLQQRVRGHQPARACSKSATMSSTASMPVDMRTEPDQNPSYARPAGDIPRCDVPSR